MSMGQPPRQLPLRHVDIVVSFSFKVGNVDEIRVGARYTGGFVAVMRESW